MLSSRADGRVPRGTIWVVEDSPLEAQTLARTLEPFHDVELFGDGAVMLEQLVHRDAPDVLLLDWRLPGSSGVEICSFLRASMDEAALPILLVTASERKEDIVEALEAGANDFVRKPYDPAELVARVAGLVRTKWLFARAKKAERDLELERDLLRESEAKLRRLSDSGLIGVIQADMNGNVVEANDAFLAMTGHGRDDLLTGRIRLPELTPSECREADDRAMRDLVETGVVHAFEKELLRKDGRRVAVVLGAALLRGTTRFIAYVLDVTEKRSAEADRERLYEAERRARAEAEVASRMKDDFLATVSHELRTPLSAILGWATLLRGGGVDPSTVEKGIAVIEKNAKSQAKLIEDILDVSRIIRGNLRLSLRSVDFAAAVETVLASVQPTAVAKRITVKGSLARVRTVRADPDRLQQIVWNLLTNAVKFTPVGGSITVELAEEDGTAVLRVSDTGQGIRPEFLPHVFERFRQADSSTTRRQAGLGLGLAIVRHLVEHHGGAVSAASEGVGRGATFTVRLPFDGVPDARSTGPHPPAIAHDEAPSEPHPIRDDTLSALKILVVDDEEDVRSMLTTVLERHGAQVIGVGSADEALTQLESFAADVLVSDIGMPIVDGYTFLKQVRGSVDERIRRVPAIALTAYARPEEAQRSLAVGYQRHLPKPVGATELVRVLLEVSSATPSAA